MCYIGKENVIQDSDDINQFWMRDSHQKKEAGMRDRECATSKDYSFCRALENVKCNTICHVFYPLRKVLCDCVTSQKQSTKFNRKKSFNGLQLRNGKSAACNHGVMDARGRLLSTKEA